jgi:FkbM family methyltransferase
METRSNEDVQRALAEAEGALTQSRSSLAERVAGLRDLLGQVRHARLRGRIHQLIWECERMAGHRQRFFSQAGQDAWLEANLFKGKRDGVFVEIGGFDGITGSNCLFFEMMRGWDGLVVEPAPACFAQCQAIRRVTVLQLALAAEEGTAEFLEVERGLRQMSGLTAHYDAGLRAAVESDPRHRGRLIEVETLPLATLLDRHGLREIDYISLDVEGGELAVLAAFPFERFAVRAWTVENNTGDRAIPALMQEKGYARVEALGVDDVYVMAGAAAGGRGSGRNPG